MFEQAGTRSSNALTAPSITYSTPELPRLPSQAPLQPKRYRSLNSGPFRKLGLRRKCIMRAHNHFLAPRLRFFG